MADPGCAYHLGNEKPLQAVAAGITTFDGSDDQEFRTMGLFEDAQADALRVQRERQAAAASTQKAQDEKTAAQQQEVAAVGEFITAMHQLKIPPARHPLWVADRYGGWGSLASRRILYQHQTAIGWSVAHPKSAVVGRTRAEAKGRVRQGEAWDGHLLRDVIVARKGLVCLAWTDDDLYNDWAVLPAWRSSTGQHEFIEPWKIWFKDRGGGYPLSQALRYSLAQVLSGGIR